MKTLLVILTLCVMVAEAAGGETFKEWAIQRKNSLSLVKMETVPSSLAASPRWRFDLNAPIVYSYEAFFQEDENSPAIQREERELTLESLSKKDEAVCIANKGRYFTSSDFNGPLERWTIRGVSDPYKLKAQLLDSGWHTLGKTLGDFTRITALFPSLPQNLDATTSYVKDIALGDLLGTETVRVLEYGKSGDSIYLLFSCECHLNLPEKPEFSAQRLTVNTSSRFIFDATKGRYIRGATIIHTNKKYNLTSDQRKAIGSKRANALENGIISTILIEVIETQ